MPRLACALLALGTIAAMLVGGIFESPRPSAAQTLQATPERHWYRGNLHTHSYWSDGDDFLENIALWYRDKGYQFLAFTDHNTLARTERWVDVAKIKNGAKGLAALKKNWGENFEQRMKGDKHEVRLRTFDEVSKLVGLPGEYLLIQGQEITDKFGKHPLHLNASHVHDVIPPMGGGSVREVLQNNVDAVIAQRERTKQPIFVHVNHPNFGWGVTAEDLMQIRGENFFEVYNGHPGVNNSGDHIHVSTERMWDIINTMRLTRLDMPVMYGIATDDGHNYHNIPSRNSEPGRGWVMVLADELTPESLIEALEAGRFYASSGVTVDAIHWSGESLAVELPVIDGVTYETEFIGTPRNVDSKSEPMRDKDGKELSEVTRKYSDDIGRVLTKVSGNKAMYRFTGDELYVRARITSSRKHPNPSEVGEFERAWIQPVRPGKVRS